MQHIYNELFSASISSMITWNDYEYIYEVYETFVFDEDWRTYINESSKIKFILPKRYPYNLMDETAVLLNNPQDDRRFERCDISPMFSCIWFIKTNGYMYELTFRKPFVHILNMQNLENIINSSENKNDRT